MEKVTPLNKYVICELCTQPTILKSFNYTSHVKKTHKVQLPQDFNLSEKIQSDQEKVQRILELRAAGDLERREERKQLRQRQEAQRREWQRMQEERKIQLLLLKQEQERQYLLAHTQNLNVIWDDIIFDKNCIKIDVTRLNAIVKPIETEGVFESLNLIKKEYFLRLYSKNIYKLQFFKGQIVPEESPGLKKLKEVIQLGKEFYQFRYLNTIKTSRAKRFHHLSNSEIISLFHESFKRSDYLKFLASKLNEDFKIIPIIEYINNKLEESFLFRIETKKKWLLIVWENVNDSRATHIFIDTRNNAKVLEKVEDFICRQDMNIKRSLLHENNASAKELKQHLNYLQYLNHNSLNDYINVIEKLISNY